MKKTTPACKVCGKPVRTSHNVTCSVVCKGLLSRGPTAKRVTVKCKSCQKEFTTLASRPSIVCSRKCAYENRKKETDRKHQRVCLTCGKTFLPGRRLRKEGWQTLSNSRTCSAACLAEREVAVKLGGKGVGRNAATEEHHRSLHAVVKSPSGKLYEVINLCKFVREHTELFLPEDVVWTAKNRTGTSFACRATSGLRAVINGQLRSWKDWMLSLNIKDSIRPID